MQLNFYLFFATAFIPMIVGLIYYNDKVFGKAWMDSAGLNEEALKGGNMLLILGISYLFSIFLSVALSGMVIHQMGLYSMLQDDPSFMKPETANGQWYKSFMDMHGHSFRTFKHGVLHGVIAALFFALPLITINALFERRSFKYIGIHAGYWTITLAIMGGVVCRFL